MPPRPPTASSVFTPTSGPTPDIRATVVAEITATAVAASTETLAPTATAVLPIPPGAFFSVGRTTPQATPTPTVAPIVTSPASTTPLVTPTQTPTHAPVPVNTPTLASVVEDISPSVVQIITPDGNGSGFVTDADGRIVTNAHVVKGLSEVEVRFTDGRTYTGRILGVDEVADVALIDIGAYRSLNAIELGDADEIMVGEDVIVMGFPLGDTLGAAPTITRGIVSAKRTSKSEVTLLQTDAAINPGNSGGPLLGRDGRVVGVSTSKLFRSEDGRPVEGIGLAISINDVRSRLDSLARGDSILLDTSSPLGTMELASALNDLLPASFEELDLEYEGITSFEEPFTEFVGYISFAPFQLVMASTGELNDLDRAELEQMLSDPDTLFGDAASSSFLEGFSSAMGVDIDGTGLLTLPEVGDWSIGIWIEDDSDIGKMRVEMVFFLQDIHIGLAAIIYSPTTEPSVSVEEIARAIDKAIVEGAD